MRILRFLTLFSVLILTFSPLVHANEVEKFWNKIPDIMEFRDRSLIHYHKLLDLIEEEKPLTRKDMKVLYDLSAERKEIREFLVDLYKNNKNVKDISLSRATLAAAAVFWLDDNFIMEAVLYQHSGKLRRLINESNKTYGLDNGDALRDSAKLYYSVKSIYRRNKVLKHYKENIEQDPSAKESLLKTNMNFKKAYNILQASFSFQKRKDMPYRARLASNVKLLGKKFFSGKFGTWDFIYKLKDAFVFNVSYVFGRSVLQIQWKKGALYYNKKAVDHLRKSLKPMDVIWDKTRSKLTGIIISLTGFWNHNALYIGTEEQIKELGIWNHELVQKYHKQISQGKTIVESLGPGVVMNRVQDIMNVNDLAVARKKNLTKKERGELVLRTLAQIGKKYDFNLDIESAETIICSELVYLVYEDVDFELTRMLGHWSITPDLTAKQTLNDGAFKLQTIFYQGQMLLGNLEQHMQNILDTKKTEI